MLSLSTTSAIKTHLALVAISLVVAAAITLSAPDIIPVSEIIYGDQRAAGGYAEINEQGYMVFVDPAYVMSDDDGVPIVNYGMVDGTFIGLRRNPVFTSMAALEYYKDFKMNGSDSSRRQFLNNADWLTENAVRVGNYSNYEYDFDWPKYNLSAPWRSGMAQGLALHVMVRAHEISQDDKYLKSAASILNSFFVEVKDGGVTYKSDDGWWYEEYAHPNAVPSRVLNGMMYAVLGIHEYYDYTGDDNAALLLGNGISALKAEISRYDNGGYSDYDILQTPSGKKYHTVHIILSEKLYEISDEEIFKMYHEKWKDYEFPIEFSRLYFGFYFVVGLTIAEGAFFGMRKVSKRRKIA